MSRVFGLVLFSIVCLQSHGVAKPQLERQARLKPTHANVAYGPFERNVLDFYSAQTDSPAPLVVCIHGGGFVGGDKNVAANVLTMYLDAGIHVAAIRYRFVDGKKILFPMPQHDGARALQFLRTQSSEWKIDKNKVACFGGSAGAGISMWLGFHDDLADPREQRSDPTRIDSDSSDRNIWRSGNLRPDRHQTARRRPSMAASIDFESLWADQSEPGPQSDSRIAETIRRVFSDHPFDPR